jgi:hypothetical protein
MFYKPLDDLGNPRQSFDWQDDAKICSGSLAALANREGY